MPLRIYAEILLIVVAGLGIFTFLLIRRKRFFLVLFLLTTLFLCSAFLPCFSLFDPVVCRGPKTEKSIALTFDDGPNEPYTSQILDILKKSRVPATFFVVGKNVLRHPEIVRRAIKEGHVIGNHTWDHRSLVLMKPSAIRAEIDGWEEAMKGASSGSPLLLRSPHGWKSPFLLKILKEKGYRLIGWTRGVWDSDQPGVEILYDRLTRRPKNGEILLLHDGAEARAGVDRSQTVEVLPRMIEFYRGLGFRFVAIGEMTGH